MEEYVHQALAHEPSDDVAIAISNVAAGDEVTVVFLSGDSVGRVSSQSDVPYGHKIALKARAAGDAVIEYGIQIGVAVAPIAAGDYVHTHNLKSARW